MNIWPKSSLRERLTLEHSIVQAPMAQISTADLVATTSNAGALGSLGSSTMSTAQVSEQVAAIRARTTKAFALNFFVHEAPTLDNARAAAMSARLANYRSQLGVTSEPTLNLPPPFDDAMLELVLALRPEAVSFHFGMPAAHAIEALKRAGMFLLATATTVPEALAIERAGFDAIVAQGTEAGGHRGTFAEPFTQGEIGLMSLLPQTVDAVRLPVIAAGGIADGRGIAAALMLGAAGVQIGTAFMGTPEVTLDPAYRRALREPRAANTRITRVFTGRPARAIVTPFVDELADQERQTLPFPLQRAWTAPLGKAALARDNPDFHSLWAGQSAGMLRQLPAAELIRALVIETERALSRASG